ncbi:EAL domain-containing protein [Noviherbaspirillum sp. L7-7A]|uniref:EAL domain-containing protein n=1 Tax=Noviherbaspirillum sp. L7-7A TaxID=2850560 RepID=UPI001C2C96A8|nr:EAL domain-containing protein [Noviherbaspirillum sp. L7-7A]MBV0881639.1 EAL domain-containing protein [Noviherbaspirillum sp. L7-7A]
MTISSITEPARKVFACLWLESLLYRLSAYVLPAAIALLSLVALLFWEPHYSTAGAQQVAFRVLEQTSGQLSLPEARQLVSQQASRQYFDTRLSEQPFWLSFEVKPNVDGMPIAIEFPSRHSTAISCWDAQSLTELGNANRSEVAGDMALVRAGFVLQLGKIVAPRKVLCKQEFVGPARLEVAEWSTSELRYAARAFERYSGLLDGGLLVLAMFVVVTAIINRESTYLLFAAWLLMNLRMAALSSGWDAQWLGHTVPLDWMTRGRSVSLALYYVLTFTLFRTLFRDELNKLGHSYVLKVTELMCVPLLIGGALLSYKTFLPMLWAFTAFGTVVLVFFLTRILVFRITPVAIWYTASLSITLISSLYEVISAAAGLKGLIGTVNFVTASLSSSLLAALAIAAQLRMKHQQWVEAQTELRETYNAMPIGLFTLDLTGKFVAVNPALRNMLGVQEIKLGNDEWSTYFDKGAWSSLHRMVTNSHNGDLEIGCNGNFPGERKRFLVKATLARGKIDGSLQDITARAKATEELQFMANNDPLTKVLNRRGIDALLEVTLRENTKAAPTMLAYLDLDRFKLINDLYGHAAGDEVLKQVCDRINAMLTGEQRVGRVGGDEFVIVFPNTPVAVAVWVCRGLVDSLGTGPYHLGDKAFQVRGSIGLIEVDPGTKIKDAVSTADRACREAKAGSNGLVVYEKNAKAFREREAELSLVEKISSSGAPEGLFLEMQPIMSLKSPHESLNFEVLLRMRDQDGSIIPAGRIIPAAESSGRIGMIDRWVLATTLEWASVHHKELTRTQFICMNLSGASLNDERFVLDAFDMLEKNRHSASLLCLEITESVALHDLENTRRFIDRVRSYGVKIALDDFGAGYTSFSYLKDLPADVLKIDGNFIVNMNAHPANVAIVEAIVNLAGNLGMKTIAEWAEDNATVQTLVEIGVDYVQGYAVSRPQSSASILAAESSAAFIQNSELKSYAKTLSILTETPIPLPAGITLISSDGMLLSK